MWRKLLRAAGIAAAAVFGLVVLVLAIAFGLAGRELGREWPLPEERFASLAGADATEGARLARLRGCFGGCHGERAEGGVFFSLFDGTRVVAPGLADVAARYGDAELEHIIRHGLRPDGTSVIGVMPSGMLAALGDRDLSHILAWMRTLPADAGEGAGQTRLGPLARLMLLMYKQETGSILAAEDAEGIEHVQVAGDAVAHGRYLAMTVCTECHGSDLQGFPEEGSPPLSVVVAYPPEAFETLMRTGKPMGDRELGLMAKVARSRFTHFTDPEIAALHGYLQARAQGRAP